MKKKLSGYKKFFKNNTSLLVVAGVIALLFGVFIFNFVNANGGFSAYYNKLFPTTQTEPSSVKPGVVETINTSTTKANKQSESTQPTVQTSQSVYVPTGGGCEKTNIVPYTTKYEYVSYLYPEQGYSSGGNDGYTFVCTVKGKLYSSNVVAPINKTIYVGTKQNTVVDNSPSAAELENIRQR